MLWAAHVYANKDRRLGNLHQVMMPVVPGMLVATGLVIFGHDLGTALVLFAILLGMLWVVGAPARVFALSFLVISVFAGALAAADPERLTRITTFTDPMRDYSSAGWQPAHGLFALSSAAACSARGSEPASRSGATSPRRTPTSSSPCSARSSGWSARCW